MTKLDSLAPGRVAVVTGAASGIGLAAAQIFAERGMHVVMADRGGDRLTAAHDAVLAGSGERGSILALPTDVSRIEEFQRLRDDAVALGEIAIVMNNAAVGDIGRPWQDYETWNRLLSVNLWGVINGVQTFAPVLIGQHGRSFLVNTGSKQGITTPPGNAAYNVSKAAVKALTEQTAHELRNVAGANASAHLLIPGFTFTGMTARSTDKPAAAWTAQQVVDFMLAGLERDDFYILCPDNDVTRPTDERRMAWAMGDVIENRPALSRWHPDYKEAFAAFMSKTAD